MGKQIKENQTQTTTTPHTAPAATLRAPGPAGTVGGRRCGPWPAGGAARAAGAVVVAARGI